MMQNDNIAGPEPQENCRKTGQSRYFAYTCAIRPSFLPILAHKMLFLSP
jgi:hypothetical protein